MNENIKHYELIYIISARIPDKDIEAKKISIKNKIESISKGITAIIDMGLRELAYKIKSQTKGYYVVITFKASSSVIQPFKSQLNLDREILRFLILKIPDDHVLSENQKITQAKDSMQKKDKVGISSKDSKIKKIRKKITEKKLAEAEERAKLDTQKNNIKNKKSSKTMDKKISNLSTDNTKDIKDVDDIKSDNMQDLSKKIDDLLNSI